MAVRIKNPEFTITGAVTDLVLLSPPESQCLQITNIQVLNDGQVAFRIGFGVFDVDDDVYKLPEVAGEDFGLADGIIASHPALAANGGYSRGDGQHIFAQGAIEAPIVVTADGDCVILLSYSSDAKI